MRCHLLVLIAVALWLLAFNTNAQIRLPVGGPNPVDVVRDAEDYRFLASLFPGAGSSFDPERDRVMSAEQQINGSNYLTMEFDVQKKTYAKQAKSVLQTLNATGVRPIHLTSPESTRVTFRDDQLAWSTTVSPAEIVIGARMIRGLLLGALRQSSSGMASFSQSLASYLGATPDAALTTQDLEARARLFFAASRKGRSALRAEEDFEQHYRNAIALMDRLRGMGGNAAVYAELERRLRTAAGGGEISGVDGMAIFDVFMRLSSHVRPALVFVLSHELGHVVLGHAPFPDKLTCAEKQKREDDADAFAIALLVYDIPGDLEASSSALARMRASDASDTEDDTLAYGYAHAVGYGFALAGLDNKIDPNCGYRDAHDRVAYLSSSRREFIAKRAGAVEQLYRYFSAHPPYIHTEMDVATLSEKQRHASAIKLFARCRAGAPTSSVHFRKLDDLPFGWVIACPNTLPTEFSRADFVSQLGTETFRQIKDEYRRRIPILMDDVTIQALLSQ